MKEIPAAALAALKEAGVDDIAVMTCRCKDGTTYDLKGPGVTATENPTFPITNTTIYDITPVSIVRHSGSTCITIIVAGRSVVYCWD